MPRAFTEPEKDRIREALIKEGERLFGAHGLRRVTVEEVAGAVGIAKGSFYTFFESKEVLYYEIFLRQERRLKALARERLGALSPPTSGAFAEFLKSSLRAVENEPVLMRFLKAGEYEKLMEALPPRYREEHTAEDLEALQPTLERWQERGYLADEPIPAIVGVIRVVYLLLLHKDDLGSGEFSGITDLLIRLIAQGLLKD
ncbi:MAG: TetR/AcrR family transcriptional regulator [Spirochaetota bacterium]